jgi:hypothetical protein
MSAGEFALLLGGVALFCFASAARSFFRTRRLIRHGVVVTGECTNQYIENDLDVSTLVYSYAGREYLVIESTATRDQAVDVGGSYDLLLDPKRPHRACLNRNLWNGALAPLLLAGLFLAFALLVLLT